LETFLSFKKKLFGKDEFIIKEKSGDKEFTYTLKSKDELVNYLKDNVPVADRKYKLDIDKSLDSNQKMVLKLSSEKAMSYQKQNGFDREGFELKKQIANTFSEEDILNENNLENIQTKTVNYYKNKNNLKNVNPTLYKFLAEYILEMYDKMFGLFENKEIDEKTISDKILNNMRNSLNLLIKSHYEIHIFKGNEVDLIKIRNYISRISMLKKKLK